MKINWLGRMYYKGPCSGTECKRPFFIALKCWWNWDIKPWLTKSDYQWGHEDKPYYRWQRYFK